MWKYYTCKIVRWWATWIYSTQAMHSCWNMFNPNEISMFEHIYIHGDIHHHFPLTHTHTHTHMHTHAHTYTHTHTRTVAHHTSSHTLICGTMGYPLVLSLCAPRPQGQFCTPQVWRNKGHLLCWLFSNPTSTYIGMFKTHSHTNAHKHTHHYHSLQIISQYKYIGNME